MDIESLNRLCPSLLVFCVIAFSLMMGLPALRRGLKAELDAALAARDPRAGRVPHFVYHLFYVEATKLFQWAAFGYLLSGEVILLQPLSLSLRLAAYSSILFITAFIIVWLLVIWARALKTAVTHSRILAAAARRPAA